MQSTINLHIRQAQATDFEMMSHFITPLNSQKKAHCLHSAILQNEILAELEDYESRAEQYFLLAYIKENKDPTANQKLIAIFGGECEPDHSEFWLWGPWVAPAYETHWQTIATQLYQHLRTSLPNIKEATTFNNILNERTHQFYLNQGFRQGTLNHEYTLARPQQVFTVRDITTPYKAEHLAGLSALHEATFPKTYYDTQQMLDLPRPRYQLLLLLEAEEVVGYIFMETKLEVEGYIHFLGVAPKARGKGYGKELMYAAMNKLFADEAVKNIVLVVRDNNAAARPMYEKMGFTLNYSAVSSHWKAG